MSYLDRPCPVCGAARVERVNHASGKPFVGCANWPECSWTMPLPVDEQMRRLGAEPLPGFGDVPHA